MEVWDTGQRNPLVESFSFFLKIIFCFLFFLAASCNMWHLSSRPGIEPVLPAVEARSLNHWTTREVPWTDFSTGIS